jgi:hypothetical protein
VVIYNKFKYFGKIIKNSNGPVISNRGSFPFFENRDNDCLLPEFRKSVLRKAKIKNKYKYNNNNNTNNNNSNRTLVNICISLHLSITA